MDSTTTQQLRTFARMISQFVAGAEQCRVNATHFSNLADQLTKLSPVEKELLQGTATSLLFIANETERLGEAWSAWLQNFELATGDEA